MRKLLWPSLKIGGREGFIPAPKEHELKRLLNIREYPYLRKYLPRKRQFDLSNSDFFIMSLNGAATG
jgi:hypothetical protein